MVHNASQSESSLAAWFAGRLPDGWFVGPPAVVFDRDEILVIGALADPDAGAGADDTARTTARAARIQGFREDTRAFRMRIADEAEARFGRKVAWGARCVTWRSWRCACTTWTRCARPSAEAARVA